MKKSLVALVVLGLSSVAMAQSSVTLYGVADAGVGKINKSNDLRCDRVTGVCTGTSKTHFIGTTLMNNGDSRVGLKGVEDIGGGLNAGFNFETGLSLADGSTRVAAPLTSLVTGFWQRQANVWVGGPWGTVKLGRQFSPSYLANSMYDLTSMANYAVVGNTYRFLGFGERRVPSAFAYISPSFSGVTAAVGYITKTDLGLPSNKAAWDAAVLYGDGPISAGLGVNKLGDSKTNYQLGGKYDFGGFAVAASYTQATRPDQRDVRRGFGLGGSAVFGAFSAVVDLSRDTKNQWVYGLLGTNKKYTNGLVELKYALSKRTSLYGAYLRLDKTNNYGLGIHHNF